MIIAAIIIGIILLSLVILTVCIGNDEDDNKFDSGVTLGVIITILLFIEAILISCIISDPHPTAMDVYQGKTTLEYRVVDNVKVDSVVIFKNDDYGKQD